MKSCVGLSSSTFEKFHETHKVFACKIGGLYTLHALPWDSVSTNTCNALNRMSKPLVSKKLWMKHWNAHGCLLNRSICIEMCLIWSPTHLSSHQHSIDLVTNMLQAWSPTCCQLTSYWDPNRQHVYLPFADPIHTLYLRITDLITNTRTHLCMHRHGARP